MEAHDNLGDLLSQEDILSKVLVHLVDSGLHECRRVCRKWYEVCNKLPVKLSLSLHSDCYFDPDQFPNAVSKLSNDISCNSAVIENHRLPCLAKLNRITHLEFSMTYWPLVYCQQDSLAALRSVRSLSFTFRTDSVFFESLETVRCLTDVTALKLDKVGVFEIPAVAPITEIKELRELSAKLCFLFNRENEFVFGTQTQLTRLGVRKDVWSFGLSSLPYIWQSDKSPRVTLKVMSVPVFHLLGCILL